MLLRSFIKYWLPLLAWMCLIFGASADRLSFAHSSRIIGPLVLWLFPHLSAETVNTIVVCVRKFAHLTEYAVLAWLFWRLLRPRSPTEIRRWQWSRAGVALLLAALYAATDEFHQTFVPSRQGSVWDVLLDTVGAAAGLGVVYLLCRFFPRQRSALR